MNKRELIEYCLTFPAAYEDYPFDAEWAVMRHGGNKKGFAFIYERGGQLCANLKCDPFRADFLRQSFRDVTSAYHMNKDHWNTVTIGGDVPEADLFEMIAHSYDLIKPKAKRNKTAALLMDIYNRLFAAYGDPHWWPAETPFEVIIGAVLTQNTAWGNVEKAIANFGDNLTPEYLLSLESAELADIIRPAGYFNQKTGYLQTVTRWFGQYGYNVDAVKKLPMDRVRSELLSLRGIGRETADSILLYAFEFPSFVIDAYTMRLIGRLPLSAGSDYESVKAFFERHLPCDEKLFNEYHALIVLHAKAHCWKTPSCTGCPLFDICATGQSQSSP